MIKSKPQKEKTLDDYKLSHDLFLDFERPVYINGKLTPYSITRSGEVISYAYNKSETPIILRSYDIEGYPAVKLAVDGKMVPMLVHRLVAIAFVDNPDNKPEVNHIDGNTANPCDYNLEWVTGKENIRHAMRTGLMECIGEDNNAAIITNDDAEEVCKLLQTGDYSYKEIHEKTGVSISIIKHIKKRQEWKHISCRYLFPLYMSERGRAMYKRDIEEKIDGKNISRPKEYTDTV